MDLSKLKQHKVDELKFHEAELEAAELEVQKLRDHVRRVRSELDSIEAVEKISQSISDSPLPPSSESSGKAEETPEDWLHPQYKTMPVMEAAKILLEAQPDKPFSNAEMTALLYDVKENSEEFVRARNSAAASLRRGAELKLFRKVGRGYFQANRPTAESPQQADLDQLERTLVLAPSSTTHEEYPQEEVVYDSL